MKIWSVTSDTETNGMQTTLHATELEAYTEYVRLLVECEYLAEDERAECDSFLAASDFEGLLDHVEEEFLVINGLDTFSVDEHDFEPAPSPSPSQSSLDQAAERTRIGNTPEPEGDQETIAAYAKACNVHLEDMVKVLRIAPFAREQFEAWKAAS